MIKCISCSILKDKNEFYKNCKSCKSCKKSYAKEYILRNKDKVCQNKKKYAENNKEFIRNYLKKYHKKYYLKNREKLIKQGNKWQKENPDLYNKYKINEYTTNINIRIRRNISSRLHSALRNNTKKSSILTFLNCTIPELKKHLESKFLPTMTWENYGKYWHVDHIIPCSKFNLELEEEQKKCFHYTNLQPLFAITQIINGVEYFGNLNKSNKLIKK